MGYIRHHAIVVTSWDEKKTKIVHKQAVKVFGNLVSKIIPSLTNGYLTFFIAPDGSKEGWDESNNRDEHRKEFIEFLNTQAYEDGSNQFRYAELYYGDDNKQSEIVKHN